MKTEKCSCLTTPNKRTYDLAEGIHYNSLHKESLTFAPKKVLFVGAHPDDIEINASGTINSLQRLFNTSIIMVVVTNGGKGTWDKKVNSQTLSEERFNEQTLAGEILNATEVIQLGYEEANTIQMKKTLLEKITHLIRIHKPDIVITHDPHSRYDFHIDHKTVADITAFSAAIASANFGYFPEQNLRHFVPMLMFFNSPSPNISFILSSEDLLTKSRALNAHESQVGGMDSELNGKELFKLWLNR